MAFTEKAKKVFKQRAFLFTLVLTIVGFICVPLIAMQAFVVGQSTEEFQRTNHEYYSAVLQSTASSFASREQMLHQAGLRISLNETIRKPMSHTATEYDLYEAAQAISSYEEDIMFVKTAGVYYVPKGFVLTNGFKYTLEGYCEMTAESESAAQMEEFFNSLNAMSYFATADGSILINARPIPMGIAGRRDAVVFFVLDTEALEESYRTLVHQQTSFAIVDENGQPLLLGADFTEKISCDKLQQFLRTKDQVCVVGDLLLYKYVNPENNVTFLLSVDRGESEERLVNFAEQVRTTTWIMAILVAVALVVTIYINYRPINRLLKTYTDKEETHGMRSEIERLESVFFKLDEKMSTHQNMVKDFILGDLLSGNHVKQELVKQYFPEDRYSSFAVLTVACPLLTTAEARKMSDELSETTGYSVYVTSIPGRPHMVIVCLSAERIVPVTLRSGIEQAVNQKFGEEYPICVGEVVGDIYALRTSYRSAVISNLPAASESWVDSEGFSAKLQRLTQCVYMGDEAEALNDLKEIKSFLCDNLPGEGMLRYYCFELLHTYLRSINNNEVSLSGQDVEALLSFASMDDLFELLERSIRQVCSQVADTERNMDQHLQERLLQYVDNNFTDSSLCLTAAADHIGVSIYALSRLFKEVTGKGFKDYVMEKRLEYGHTLLCSTAKSIADVSADAGFDNANYFSTVFKAKYGMPPTKYRRLLKDKPKEQQPVDG